MSAVEFKLKKIDMRHKFKLKYTKFSLNMQVLCENSDTLGVLYGSIVSLNDKNYQ